MQQRLPPNHSDAVTQERCWNGQAAAAASSSPPLPAPLSYRGLSRVMDRRIGSVQTVSRCGWYAERQTTGHSGAHESLLICSSFRWLISWPALSVAAPTIVCASCAKVLSDWSSVSVSRLWPHAAWWPAVRRASSTRLECSSSSVLVPCKGGCPSYVCLWPSVTAAAACDRARPSVPFSGRWRVAVDTWLESRPS